MLGLPWGESIRYGLLQGSAVSIASSLKPMVTSHALSLKAQLVITNIRRFSKVPGLMLDKRAAVPRLQWRVPFCHKTLCCLVRQARAAAVGGAVRGRTLVS